MDVRLTLFPSSIVRDVKEVKIHKMFNLNQIQLNDLNLKVSA